MHIIYELCSFQYSFLYEFIVKELLWNSLKQWIIKWYIEYQTNKKTQIILKYYFAENRNDCFLQITPPPPQKCIISPDAFSIFSSNIQPFIPGISILSLSLELSSESLCFRLSFHGFHTFDFVGFWLPVNFLGSRISDTENDVVLSGSAATAFWFITLLLLFTFWFLFGCSFDDFGLELLSESVDNCFWCKFPTSSLSDTFKSSFSHLADDILRMYFSSSGSMSELYFLCW